MNDDLLAVTVWVDLVAEIVALDPEHNAARVRTGLTRLAARADAQFPQLSSGGLVSLGPADLDGALSGIPDEMQESFINLTGDCLFRGVDGPNVTAMSMQDTIDQITTKLRSR